ncbi:hypothetical protein MUK42_06809 [Musa troglodytarum]|uniref:Uncharacterized protein n=1 Tax=Musa troglodytarum TaxID=320322 RepID=A0A9E7HKM9_9LILI|nr:hypothetical protein MUK42_06809 [Musa troglodytarum]
MTTRKMRLQRSSDGEGHDEEGSWTWQDTKKCFVEWNALGGRYRTQEGAEGSWPLWSKKSWSTTKEGILAQVGLLLPLLALIVVLVFFLIVVEGGNDRGARDELTLGWLPAGSDYRRSIAECLRGDEFELGMKATRRILPHSAITPFPSLKMQRG